jgi:enediyne biosynthesis protein E4
MPRFSFTNVAKEAGLDFQHAAGTRPLDTLQTTGAGLAWIDFDRDGRPDLFCVNQAPKDDPHATGHRLYHNRGDGRFQDVTDKAGVRARGHYGMGAAVADYDGDGWPDLLVTGFGANHLYRNRRTGDFEDVTEAAGLRMPPAKNRFWSTAAAFFDADGDGDLDLYITNYCNFDGLANRLCDVRGIKTACSPTLYQGQLDFFYRNLGKGKFELHPKTFSLGARKPGRGLGVLPFDADGDGSIDVFIANDGNGCFFFHNINGQFVEAGYRVGLALDRAGGDPAGMGVDALDYDGDGRLDLAVGNFQNLSNLVFHQDQPLQFSDVSEETGLSLATRNVLTWGTRFTDFDLDGQTELLFVNGHVQDNIPQIHPGIPWEQKPQLFRFDGQGFVDDSAQAGSPFSTPINGRGCALADYDGDGDEDVAVSVNGGAVQLWRNDRAAGHWIRVELRGKQPNTEAIGASVTVQAGGKDLTKHVLTGRGYLSDSERTLTFGLGAGGAASEIRVRWPNGQRQSLKGGWTNQVVRIHQGAP